MPKGIQVASERAEPQTPPTPRAFPLPVLREGPEGSTLANDDDFVIWARMQGAPEQDMRMLTGVGAELGKDPVRKKSGFSLKGRVCIH